MDGNSETTTSDTISTTPHSASALPAAIKSSPVSLCRVGSGTSVVIDAEGGVEAESRKLPSSRFKGVVPQPNGRWGSQIYEKHQRVWLGTFNEQEEAAKAYDIAAQRFRGRDAVTNFKPLSDLEEDDVESAFLNSHSKAEIVDMLRKHTYNDEFQQSKKNFALERNGKKSIRNGIFILNPFGSENSSGLIKKVREKLFDKSVTPSDVGKLNRLVIPKQHAEKHLPLQNGNTSKGMLLNFEDNGGKVWRFRYSYWNSSQSYVLTKGWSRFVKEKCLKAGDVVSFQKSTGQDKQLYIDWKPKIEASSSANIAAAAEICDSIEKPAIQMLRLFGVNIVSSNGKRGREMEDLGLEFSKKPRVINAL